MKKWFVKNLKWLIMIVFILAFLMLAQLVIFNQITIFDNSIIKYIEQFHHIFLTIFLDMITRLANAEILLLMCLAIYIFINKKNYALLIIINVLLSTILNSVLKIIFMRPRPLMGMIDASGFSFPSGHAMAAMSFYGFIIYLIWKTKLSKQLKWLITWLLSLLIILIGLSRVYLGVHYPSDIIGGFCISIVYLIIFISLTKKYIK